MLVDRLAVKCVMLKALTVWEAKHEEKFPPKKFASGNMLIVEESYIFVYVENLRIKTRNEFYYTSTRVERIYINETRMSGKLFGSIFFNPRWLFWSKLVDKGETIQPTTTPTGNNNKQQRNRELRTSGEQQLQNPWHLWEKPPPGSEIILCFGMAQRRYGLIEASKFTWNVVLLWCRRTHCMLSVVDGWGESESGHNIMCGVGWFCPLSSNRQAESRSMSLLGWATWDGA